VPNTSSVLCTVVRWLCTIDSAPALFLLIEVRVVSVAKLLLRVQLRKSNGGYFIASVPRKRLLELSGCRKLRWSFDGDWLVLEAWG
jgi:hypothetical protein